MRGPTTTFADPERGSSTDRERRSFNCGERPQTIAPIVRGDQHERVIQEKKSRKKDTVKSAVSNNKITRDK